MAFIVKMLFYGFWLVSGLLCLYYLFTGLTETALKNNPFYIKQGLALISLYGIFKLHKAYQLGEQQHRFAEGMFQISMIWIFWAMLLIVYVGLKKWYA
jgi:hypothetical protein